MNLLTLPLLQKNLSRLGVEAHCITKALAGVVSVGLGLIGDSCGLDAGSRGEHLRAQQACRL